MGAQRHQPDGIAAAIIDNATLIERVGKAEGGGIHAQSERHDREGRKGKKLTSPQQTLDQECRQAAEKIQLTLAARQSE